MYSPNSDKIQSSRNMAADSSPGVDQWRFEGRTKIPTTNQRRRDRIRDDLINRLVGICRFGGVNQSRSCLAKQCRFVRSGFENDCGMGGVKRRSWS